MEEENNRDYGLQPLDALMREAGLENHALVAASTEQLTHKMEKEGVGGCAKAICNMFGSNAERAKDLAYRLYTIAERKGWAQEAYAYNSLVIAWPEIQSKAAELQKIEPEQLSMF